MLFAIAPLLFSAAIAATPAKMPTRLVTDDCRFGDVYAFNPAQCQMEVRNLGDKPIRLSAFVPEKGGDDTIEPREVVVAAHAHAYLTAKLAIGNENANVRHVFRFHSDEAGHEERVITARGFVMTVLDQRPLLDFGVVDLAHPVKPETVPLGSHDVADFRIEKIVSVPAWLDVVLADDGRSLRATVRQDAQWGFHIDQIKLATNSTLQSQVWVGVQADIHGKVIPASNPVNFGLMRAGNHNEQLIRLTSTDDKAFSVGKMETDGFKGQATAQDCVPAQAGCKIVKLVIADDQPLGSVKGNLWVELPQYKQRMPIAVWGMLIAKQTEIDKVDIADLMKKSDKSGASSAPGNSGLNLNAQLKNAINTAEAVDPPGDGPLLKWSVVNEEVLHGFQIFRGDSADGPFLLLNKSAIPAQRTPGAGAHAWRDDSAVPGKTYWYYIGIVYNNGDKQQLTGPSKVLAK